MSFTVGSSQTKKYLEDLAELADSKDAAKQRRKLDADLQVQGLQNQGQSEVATIRNTGAVDVQKLQDTASMERQKSQEAAVLKLQDDKQNFETPLQQSQIRLNTSHGNYYDSKAEMERQDMTSLNKLRESQAGVYNAQAENQSFTNSLARKYGDQRVKNELSLQSAGTDKIGMELQALTEGFDRQKNDAAMLKSVSYLEQNPPYVPESMQDYKYQVAEDAKANPLMMSKGEISQYAQRNLGDPSPVESLVTNLPFAGVPFRWIRGLQAKNKAAVRAKQLGVALPE